MKITNLYSAGFIHWGFQRSSALILISLILIDLNSFVTVESFYLSYILLSLVVVHLKLGLETLIKDYIHDLQLKSFANILLRLIGIFILKCIFCISIVI